MYQNNIIIEISPYFHRFQYNQIIIQYKFFFLQILKLTPCPQNKTLSSMELKPSPKMISKIKLMLLSLMKKQILNK